MGYGTYRVANALARSWDANARNRGRAPRPPFNTDGYPTRLKDYVGQQSAKRQLEIAIAAARMRQIPMRNALITSGTPGVGKTALAVAISGELDVKVEVLSGVITADQAMDALAALNDRDVLFIDEIHRVVDGGKKNGEWLLHLLADGHIIDGAGVHPMPAVTIIGATTDAGRLPETITSRFPLVCQLEPYTFTEARTIVMNDIVDSWPSDTDLPSDHDVERIVNAANRNPRTMKALLSSVLDAATVKAAGGRDVPFEEILDWHGLTVDGLDKLAQRLLLVLPSEFGGIAGERPLAARLREPGGLRYAEQVLQDKGYLTLTPKGRAITVEGRERALALAEAGVTV